MADQSATEQAVAAFAARPGAVTLTGVVQHYDWGGYEFLPDLLGTDNAERKPFAELWMGAHPNAPATATIDGAAVTLDRLIAEAPARVLGPAVAERFAGRLPYLFKVLDAHKMLSIQAHPSKAQAEEGFARENAAGIPLTAAHRNYKDDNHKPEVHVALTDFWMLHGFRPLEEIAATLQAVPELTPLMPDFGERLAQSRQDAAARKTLLRSLYETAMTLPQERIDALLVPLVERLQREAPADKGTANYWALRAAETFPLPGGHVDRGLISVYLLNLVSLRPGQATYQPAGTLHAYLEGVNVELMANSDNVLRGGLTPKHVDVAELLRVLTFESGTPEVIAGEAIGGETIYRTPAAEFSLSRLDIDTEHPFRQGADHEPDTLVVLEGSVTVRAEGADLARNRGEVCFIPYGVAYAIEASAAVVYRASVPE